MQVLSDIQSTHQAVRELQQIGKTVGLVPTMGALHAGHRSLMDTARKRCDAVAVTIFVNPTQFGPNEDFSKYPRPLEADLRTCRDIGADLVFTPSVHEMYGQESLTVVSVQKLSQGLCGPFRPGHFDGVATVVAKLFNILPADVAFFGEKDYQQLRIIQRMVRDLNIPIEIIGCSIVREPDGLAMSSRNVYLSAAERRQALSLSRALSWASEQITRGARATEEIVASMRSQILAAGPANIEYIEIVDAETLAPLREVDRPARICLAVRIGATRLIDNIGVDATPTRR